jgi:L-ascorbate metabolism protein UlaG (beta-lactamase superfamily)
MKITYFGHSCVLIENNETKILIDPFISGNPLIEKFDLNSIDCNYILISHGHADHILDAEAIAKNTNATVVSSWEIYEWLSKKGIENIHPMNTGGNKTFENFKLKCVVAQHSSGLPDGTYGGNPMGFLITIDDRTIYFSGDTALTLDMKLIPLWAKIDLAILPIGDNFTMGVDDAVRAAHFVETTKIFGVHYNTFGFIEINTEDAKTIFQKNNLELILKEFKGEYIF